MLLSNWVFVVYTPWFLHWASFHMLSSHLHFLCELLFLVFGLMCCFSLLTCESYLPVMYHAKGYVHLKFWQELFLFEWSECHYNSYAFEVIPFLMSWFYWEKCKNHGAFKSCFFVWTFDHVSNDYLRMLNMIFLW